MLEFHLPKTLKRRKIRFSPSDIEPQEVFLDSLARKKDDELGIPENKTEVPLSSNILRAFLLCIALLFFTLFGLTFKMQVYGFKKYSALSEQNKFVIHSVEEGRGVIYDSKGNQLVFNKPSFNLIINKNDLPKNDAEKERILNEISNIIGEPKEKIEEKIVQCKEEKPILIAEIIDHKKLILLETKISEFPGFEIQKSMVREYKDGPLYSHIIGYTGMINSEELKNNSDNYSGFDQIGRTGIEKIYEEVLRRNPGEIRVERDVYGNQISKEVISLPESGESLVLWLDAELQRKIEEELRKTMETVGAEKAVGVAINPQTGGLLAMVSIPSFDNNIFSQKKDSEELKNLLNDKAEPLLNRAIAGKYAVGSTIKPFIASAALEEKIISPDKVISCPGKITITHRYDPSIIYEFDDWMVHGSSDMRSAIAESCNVYFYTIGGGYQNQKGLGPTKIKKYLDLFGWEEKTGIDIPNELEGFVPSTDWKKEIKKESWLDGDTYNLSIGQGDLGITPLEVASAYSAVANGGTLYKPKVVKEIIDSEKKVIEEIKPEITRSNFISSDNLNIVREGMRHTVTGENAPNASCKRLNTLPVSSAAKTGTAQTPYPDHYHNWITVFAPYDNPQIVITLMVENVNEKTAIVIPTAKEILQWYFTR